MDYNALADLLFPGLDEEAAIAKIEADYPPRSLPEGAKVTRMAPSPTGFMHLGNLFGAIADERLAHQSGGVFYLRIEDTDQKREVPGAVETILKVFSDYELPFDEGATADGDNGAYGPYRQRQREGIYRAYAKRLVRQGKAYPCFCTEEELAAIREKQAAEKANFGYYGSWAVHRDTPLSEVESRVAAGEPFVLRFRSEGDPGRRTKFTDLVRGTMELPENDQDVVLLKSDGIPTYHFAHVVDDHLMGTTHVVRGEEWLATLPIHIQLFGAMGWKMPKYVHTAQLMKLENGNKRKLSKRKDPELALDFYQRQGYCVAAVKEYLMTLLNSNFEDWRLANPDAPLDKFPFNTKKMGVSGALFDIEKLGDVSKNVISRMSAAEVADRLTAWAREYDPDFCALLERDPAYTEAILSIGRGGKKPRKDIAVWSGAKEYLSFFFDELFTCDGAYPENVSAADAKRILDEYAAIYDPADDSGVWFDRIKALAERLGYAANMKDYKQNPSAYRGSVADVSMVLRVAVTGRQNSPDMYEIMRLLGRERVLRRLGSAAENLN
ncbi:glutamate--tRNA ligase [Anaerotruncus massiliensis (ex Liu et al. 2021)]|uniref:Glutamate--tRNA ligase n=2 Tax=Anaerotruncus TaxID=244127 RepID=A0A498CKW1_9FIRM|nr:MULTISPECIES: glutamate--tRNA ligase [Anaerotruncus]MBC3939474.1 glutamate--tRNA ligase [Anaerotruncus massiliensis (ex Togo et al. 2019)]RLL09022.1 glutamate--tRNA ligase [Anaerotruncus massiliensis (ex Liu et al. 2021)]